MNEEKDFFKTCFNTVVGLEVKNESQAIAKEVVLSEIENLQQENKQLKEDIKNIIKILEKNCDDLEATEEEFDSLDRWQGLQVVELEQGSDSNE